MQHERRGYTLHWDALRITAEKRAEMWKGEAGSNSMPMRGVARQVRGSLRLWSAGDWTLRSAALLASLARCIAPKRFVRVEAYMFQRSWGVPALRLPRRNLAHSAQKRCHREALSEDRKRDDGEADGKDLLALWDFGRKSKG